jgi:hypothetical protein
MAVVTVMVVSVVPGHRAGCRSHCHWYLFLLSREQELQNYGIFQKHGASGKSLLVRFEVFMAVRMMMFWAEALKMETVCFSETLACSDKSTQCQNPEHHHHHHHQVITCFIHTYVSQTSNAKVPS